MGADFYFSARHLANGVDIEGDYRYKSPGIFIFTNFFGLK